MKNRTAKHSIDKVFVFLLFGLFAILIVIVLLLGVNNYKSLLNRNNEAYNERIAINYIAEKVRHNDIADGVSVGDFIQKNDSISTLYMYQKINQERYVTRIYYYKGYIRELFSLNGMEVQPEDGNTIMKASDLSFSIHSRQLTIQCIDEDGAQSDLSLYLRSGEDDTP